MPSVAEFLAACPRARIELDRIASEIQVSLVAEGKADLGILRLPVLRREPGVRFVELAPESLWVALPTGHPLAGRASLRFADLQQEPFVSAVHRERGGLARLVTDLCLRSGFVPGLARVTSRKTSMLDLVAAGLGVAVVPERMTRLATEGLTYRRLADEGAEALSALVLPRDATALAERFAAILTRETG